jgi:hypothetical protein
MGCHPHPDLRFVDQWSGTVAYTQVVYPLTAGMHHFNWGGVKDKSDLDGSETAWIDTICGY